jgi:uncharacterized repeat protein (TIGR03803 family)
MMQQQISKMRRVAAGAALTLAVVLAPAIALTQSAQAQTYKVLHEFTGAPDGAYPYGGLVQDAAGNLYGTTSFGGSSYFGAVFEVDASGTESVLYSFTGATAGAYPFAGLIQDTVGNLYGTTNEGGAFTYGVVFKLDTSGNEKVLHSFSANYTDGQDPEGGLVLDKNGDLYGTTNEGGRHNLGTVFRVDATGKEKVLHTFAGGPKDGAYPFLTSLLLANGNFYGVTPNGGASNYGMVYRMSKKGKVTVLYSFTGGTNDGCYPHGTPLIDSDGNLYGSTSNCGASGKGTVWELSAGNVETVLHSFAGGSSDGAYPYAGVIMDTAGNLYGVTVNGGGTLNVGAVYELTPGSNGTWTETILHGFGQDGAYPYGGLIQDTNGNLYGTTYNSTQIDTWGTVWEVTP